MRAEPGLRQLLRLWEFVRPVKWSLFAGFASALTAAVLSLVGPQIIRLIVDGPVSSGERAAIIWGSLALLAVGCFEAFLWYLRRILVLTPMVGVERRVRDRLFARLQDLPAAFHDEWEAGQLLSRSSVDLNRVRRWLAFGLIMLTVNLLTVVAGIGVLLWLDPLLGIVYAVFSIPTALITLRFQRVYGRLSRRSQDQAGALATTVGEAAKGIRVIKAFGRGGEFLASFRTEAQALRETELEKARKQADMRSWLILLPQLAVATSLALGVLAVAGGRLTIGELSAFLFTALMLSWPVRSLGFLFADTLDAAASTTRVFEVLDTATTVSDPAAPLPVPVGPGVLEFRGVRFRFPDARDDDEVLQGIDLTLRPGETLALVGATGSGKSLLSELAVRLHDPTDGEVLLDGTDIRRFRRDELRSHVAIAFEQPLLFSASVRDNVALGRPEASDDELREALTVAQAGFALELPDGLDTLIGEEGHSLSGGQRQRLALARAIIARPRVLVLDDPLSAVDVRTETLATEALRTALTGVTTLVVAHRSSTVALADRVAVLQDGRITAVGEHRSLLAADPVYRGLLWQGDHVDEVVA
ncbi:ABC transporter ATP-binding protein [Pseudoclavibacter helvolus]|uniref:ATP-binding cassette subfamily B protein n=1 Tax=Pseudoclavibacter helvolus TaxID=255205 RepID=A0A7W4UKD6_9MICO|nr:ABC transporter ATP-binding protein [Pseudoclavibacter helvolus]MBB2956055.1 ATP-binding cassette subfamily B protein [Pseudoclavibacter helvolus]